MFNSTVAEGWRKRIDPSDRKKAEEGEKAHRICQKELGVVGAWLCTVVRREKPLSPGAIRRKA